MLTIYPDYAQQMASRAAHKAVQLTDPMRQLASLLDIARSDDAEQGLMISLDQLGRIQPFLADLEEKGGKTRYVVTIDSGMPLEAAWSSAVAKYPTVELGQLDLQDQAAYEHAQRQKPLKPESDYPAIRKRANDRPGAKPVMPMISADPTDPDNWED